MMKHVSLFLGTDTIRKRCDGFENVGLNVLGHSQWYIFSEISLDIDSIIKYIGE